MLASALYLVAVAVVRDRINNDAGAGEVVALLHSHRQITCMHVHDASGHSFSDPTASLPIVSGMENAQDILPAAGCSLPGVHRTAPALPEACMELLCGAPAQNRLLSVPWHCAGATWPTARSCLTKTFPVTAAVFTCPTSSTPHRFLDACSYDSR